MSKPLPSPAERVKIPGAVAITGESARTLQALAAAGRIPGAYRPAKAWTFDVAALRKWVKEGKPCQVEKGHGRTRSGGVTFSGRRSLSTGRKPGSVSTSASPSDQAIERLRRLASTRADAGR